MRHLTASGQQSLAVYASDPGGGHPLRGPSPLRASPHRSRTNRLARPSRPDRNPAPDSDRPRRPGLGDTEPGQGQGIQGGLGRGQEPFCLRESTGVSRGAGPSRPPSYLFRTNRGACPGISRPSAVPPAVAGRPGDHETCGQMSTFYAARCPRVARPSDHPDRLAGPYL